MSNEKKDCHTLLLEKGYVIYEQISVFKGLFPDEKKSVAPCFMQVKYLIPKGEEKKLFVLDKAIKEKKCDFLNAQQIFAILFSLEHFIWKKMEKIIFMSDGLLDEDFDPIILTLSGTDNYLSIISRDGNNVFKDDDVIVCAL